jgi:hypothetical protein
MRGDLRFGIHSGQQHTDFPGYVALWQAADLRTIEVVAKGVAPVLNA